MDPNANLAEQAACLQTLTHARHEAWRDARTTLAQLRASLTEWLTSGGFAPEWSRYPAAARYYGISVPYGGTVGTDYRDTATR